MTDLQTLAALMLSSRITRGRGVQYGAGSLRLQGRVVGRDGDARAGGGGMKPHKSDCPDCNGTGHDEEDGSVCLPCDGGGQTNWEWDPDDIGQCECCGAKSEQPLMGCGPDADVWICRDCVQLAHREQCGCSAKGWT